MPDSKSETKTSAKANGADEGSKVKLLISCLKHTSNGVIDWQAVAEDCEITGTDGQPSKGAANKRYVRTLKAHGIDPATVKKGSATANRNDDGGGSKKAAARGKCKSSNKDDKTDDSVGEDEPPVNKKRKVDEVIKDELDEDDGMF